MLDQILADIRKTFDVDFVPLQLDDGQLEVLNINNMQSHLDGLLARHAIHDKLEPEGKTMLELGGGCGVLSLVASRYGFRHIVTSDIVNDALQFARANVLRNKLQDLIDVCYLDVSRPGKDERFPEGFDRIVASELLYLDDLHRPLLKFVDRHLAPGGKAVFCTDMARAKPHFAKLAAKTFQVQEGHIGVKSQDADGKEQRRIYVLHILERKQ